ncbi:MAG: hypothetical protein WKG00_36010 [Polyangiaceae bacterium]
MRRWLTPALLLGAVTIAWPAHAERARVALGYQRAADAPAECPDEATFRALVAARLGYDPFVADGRSRLDASLQKRGQELIGRLVLQGDDPAPRERELRARPTECFELATSMALAAAVAIDPEAARTGKAPPEMPPPPSAQPLAPPPTVTPPRPPPPPPPAAETRLGVRGGVGAVLPVGVVPAPRGGLRLLLALDGGAWTLGAEGSFLFPSRSEASFGSVGAWVANGALVPCARPSFGAALSLDFCAVAAIGLMRSDAEGVTRSEPTSDVFATVGPRVGVSLFPWAHVGFEATADLAFPLSRIHLYIDDRGVPREVWSSAPVGFVGCLSTVVRFR